MSVPISPTLLFMTILELLVIPIAILVVGFVLFYFKPRHRRLIGSALIVLGILDLSIVLIRYPFVMLGDTLFITMLTILLGIISIFYSSKYH